MQSIPPYKITLERSFLKEETRIPFPNSCKKHTFHLLGHPVIKIGAQSLPDVLLEKRIAAFGKSAQTILGPKYFTNIFSAYVFVHTSTKIFTLCFFRAETVAHDDEILKFLAHQILPFSSSFVYVPKKHFTPKQSQQHHLVIGHSTFV